MPLVDFIPSIKRPGGGRRCRPDSLYADQVYDADEKMSSNDTRFVMRSELILIMLF
jgi:hypothetical protein